MFGIHSNNLTLIWFENNELAEVITPSLDGWSVHHMLTQQFTPIEMLVSIPPMTPHLEPQICSAFSLSMTGVAPWKQFRIAKRKEKKFFQMKSRVISCGIHYFQRDVDWKPVQIRQRIFHSYLHAFISII